MNPMLGAAAALKLKCPLGSLRHARLCDSDKGCFDCQVLYPNVDSRSFFFEALQLAAQQVPENYDALALENSCKLFLASYVCKAAHASFIAATSLLVCNFIMCLCHSWIPACSPVCTSPLFFICPADGSTKYIFIQLSQT